VTQAIIIAGGALSPVFISSLATRKDIFLIACDRGATYLKEAGIIPQLLVGDLDSIEPTTLADLAQQQITIEQYPIDKEASDLELAIDAAIRRGFEQITISCALGNRTDYILANTSLLLRQKYRELQLSIQEDAEWIYPLYDGVERVIIDPPHERFSVIVQGEGYVTINEATWNLDEEYIVRGSSRLVSNLIKENSVSITVKKTAGLLVFSTHT
jgi:thiamine pyrophosphokinase